MFQTGWLIYVVGFLAQALFSTRILVQWIMSERARHVLSPTIFWALSLAASCMMCVYGWLRADFAIIAGQIISFYIYIWNLNVKGAWRRLNKGARWLIMLLPMGLLVPAMVNAGATVDMLFANNDIPLWLLVFGTAGQVVFTFRFIYQWLYSRRRGESELPAGFWIISLTGSAIIVSYAIIRHDPVLILGQSVGLVAYTRNLMLLRHS